MTNIPQKKHVYRALTFSFALLAATSVCAEDTHSTHPEKSATNKRDRADSALTADQQSNKKSDLELTRTIRRSITQDDQLSMDAHNVKIITANGKVTLKGPVHSEQEKATVEQKAQTVAGVSNVRSELEIASKQGG